MQDLEARLAALEAQVAAMRAALELAGRGRTMRQTHRCPACGHGRVLHFRTIRDVGHNQLHLLTLQKERSVWFGVKNEAAPLEAFVCKACHLVEWHVISLEGVEVDGADIAELIAEDRPSPSNEPYR
jgi:hypothetical protein